MGPDDLAANTRAVVAAARGTIILRVVTEWVGLVNQYGVGFPHTVAKHPTLLTQVWLHWDAGFYVSIARYGYAAGTRARARPPTGSPSPPCTRGGSGWSTGSPGLDWTTSAELLSTVALFVGLVALHRLAASFGGDGLGGTSVVMLLAFPTAFFLLAPYPESTALALVAVSWCAPARDGGWRPACARRAPPSPSTTWSSWP